MIQELADAISTKLLATSALTALLATPASVFADQAPPNAPKPYVIFRAQGGGDENRTPHRTKNLLVQVRGFSVKSQAEARSIDAAIDAALHHVALTVTGWTNYWLAREGDIDLVENPPDGKTVYTAGGIYRARIAK
jgi:hypothetical protein